MKSEEEIRKELERAKHDYKLFKATIPYKKHKWLQGFIEALKLVLSD